MRPSVAVCQGDREWPNGAWPCLESRAKCAGCSRGWKEWPSLGAWLNVEGMAEQKGMT
jgi:hypothetical protein